MNGGRAPAAPLPLKTAPWAEATAALPAEGRCLGVQLGPDGVWLFRRVPPVSRSIELFCSLEDVAATLGHAASGPQAVAVQLPRPTFERWLRLAVDLSYDPARYPGRQAWRLAVRFARVQLQWVVARDPRGEPLARQEARLRLAPDLARELDSEVLRSAPVADLLPHLADRSPVRQPHPLHDPQLRRNLLGEEA